MYAARIRLAFDGHYGDGITGITGITAALRGITGITGGITGTGYELQNFTNHSQRQTFASGTASSLAATRQAVDLLEA